MWKAQIIELFYSLHALLFVWAGKYVWVSECVWKDVMDRELLKMDLFMEITSA